MLTLPISGDDLVRLIPQKPPFVLISTLHEMKDNRCITSFRFDAGHVLCDNGALNFAGLMENIAQTSGCFIGYENFLKGVMNKVGFIGEVRDFVFSRLPLAGEELTTEVIMEKKVFDVSIISALIRVNGIGIASCKMKIFVEPEKD